MDAGYNTEEFIEFIRLKKADGDNIELWEFNDLKQVVGEFVESKKPKQPPPPVQEPIPEKKKEESVYSAASSVYHEPAKSESKVPEPPSPQPKPTESKEEVKQVISSVVPPSSPPKIEVYTKEEAYLALYKEPFPQVLKTQVPDKAGAGLDDIKCVITEVKVVDPGLFRSKFASYIIKTPSKGWEVERRMSSFVDLRNYFLSMYPGYILPPLPKNPEKKLEKPYLEKKKHFLQVFLNDVLRHPVLKTSSLLAIFLSISLEKEYESKKKVYAKLPVPREVGDYRTLTGEAKVDANQHLHHYGLAVGTGVLKLKECYKELKIANDELAVDLARVGKTVEKLNVIHNCIARTYNMLDEGAMEDLFVSLSGSFEKLNQSILALRMLVMEDLSRFFRNYNHELLSVEELVKTWKDSKAQVAKVEKALLEKKEALFLSRNISSWELDPKCSYTVDTLLHNKEIAFKEMIPEKTRGTAKFRVIYGYYSNKVLEEFMRINRKNEDEIKTQTMKIAKKNCDIFQDINLIWADLVAHLASIKDTIDMSDPKIKAAHDKLPPNFIEEKIKAMKSKGQ